MSNTIDKLIMDIGKGSNNAMQQKYQSTYYQASKIIELMDRKRKMINLKVAVEECLNKLNKTNRRILSLVFIDGVKSEMIAQIMGISIRTFFRKKNDAIQQFSLIFQSKGYDEEFFETEYGCEQWFLSVYNSSLARGVLADDVMDKYLVKRVFNEASKISNLKYNVYV